MEFQRNTEGMLELRRDSSESFARLAGVLATSGEASDGHILNPRGITFPSGGLPLLFNHSADMPLGRWSDLQATDDELRGSATIELRGHGADADKRKDIAHMAEAGSIQGFSLRWVDGDKPAVYRTSLPKEHPAYVAPDESSSKRYGLYFETAQAIEGSLTPIPADQSALIGRMQATEGATRSFWRNQAMSLGVDNPDRFYRDSLSANDALEILLRCLRDGDGVRAPQKDRLVKALKLRESSSAELAKFIDQMLAMLERERKAFVEELEEGVKASGIHYLIRSR